MKFLLFFLIAPALAASFDWEGHRGARGLMPENTIPAMLEALRYPVTTLELDVVISKDKKVVVSHEPWMNPVICKHPEGKSYKEKEINLYQLDYAEILRFDCGSLPYPRFPEQKKISVGKPTLAALLHEIETVLTKEKRKVLYNIEIKSDSDQEKHGFQPRVSEFSDLVMGEVRAHLPLDRFVIQSFDPRVLKHVHQKYPDVTLSFLTEEKTLPVKIKKILGFYPSIYSPDYQTLAYDEIPTYHAEGMRVIPWTVNTRDDMKKLMGMGVDGIITDYPNLISQVTLKDCPADTNYFEGDCVKVPAHAVASSQNPGWDCKPGFVQKRFHCEKIKIPSHAHLTPDGKGWECKDGYKRYRGRCQKK